MKRALDRAASSSASVSPVVEFLRARVPVHFGGMSDPFQPAEERLDVTRQFLLALRAHRYPTVISTRSPLVASDRFIEILRGMSVVVQFSLSTIDDRRAAIVEPLAPRPSSVLRCMRALAKADITVSSRWQPFIPGFSPPPDEYVDAVAQAGARQVSFEHLKIPTENSWNPLLSRGASVIQALKKSYMQAGAHRDGREFILPAPQKVPTVLTVRAACHQRNIAFGAADNEFQYLSDGDACCSGVDIIADFASVYRYTIPHIIKSQMMRCNEIYFSTDSLWHPEGSIDLFLKSKSRLNRSSSKKSRTVESFMKVKWNDIGSAESPARYYGISFTGETDSRGMNIYIADKNVMGMIDL